MKAILITDESKWCRLMMNGDKTVEARKGDKLYKATQKLIDEYGYAVFYVCCKKTSPWLDWSKGVAKLNNGKGCIETSKSLSHFNGKVAFKFRCYKVEELSIKYGVGWQTKTIKGKEQIEKLTQLSVFQLFEYCGRKTSTAIHISDLEIFDKPKELSEFYKVGHYEDLNDYCTDEKQINGKWCIPIKKAPQSFCYVETGGCDNG